jgi:hypothetical protein
MRRMLYRNSLDRSIHGLLDGRPDRIPSQSGQISGQRQGPFEADTFPPA